MKATRESITLREQAKVDFPNFPWLSTSDPDGIARFMAQHEWLHPGETITAITKAGDGNMNLTLRVNTTQRSLIVKQARPWVEKYDSIPAPWDRALYEQRFYDRVQSIPEVANAMPKLIAADSASKSLVLEDIVNACDFSSVYQGASLDTATLERLAEFLFALHRGTHGNPDPTFENREMRFLNHEHIFMLPLDPDNGIDLDSIEPGLQAVAQKLMNDSDYTSIVAETGKRYLADGQCLVHGDYFPGSWLNAADGPIIIDPEFCFYGDPEFDLGVCIGHLCLSSHQYADAQAFLNAYAAEDIDHTRIARYAAIEVMRRLIGVAQLPIEQPTRSRCDLLRASHRATLRGHIDELWKDQ